MATISRASGKKCGITIEFKRDASGKVTEAVLDQLGTVIILKKK